MRAAATAATAACCCCCWYVLLRRRVLLRLLRAAALPLAPPRAAHLDEAEHALDGGVDRDLRGVLEHEREGVHGAGAEADILDEDVDVGVRVDKLDRLLEAPQEDEGEDDDLHQNNQVIEKNIFFAR